MQKMNCQAIGYGYIIIPKALLKEQLTGCSPHEGEIEAFLKLLIKVNYSETKLTDRQKHTIVCKRGAQLPQLERHFPLANEQNLPLHTTTENKRNHRNHSSQRHHRPAYPSGQLRKLDKHFGTRRREKRKRPKNQRRKVPPLLGRLPQHPAASQREHRQSAAYLEKAERKRTATRHRQHRRVLLSSDKREIHPTCLQLFIQ